MAQPLKNKKKKKQKKKPVLTHALVNGCTSGACCIGSDWAGFTAGHLFIFLVGSIRASFAWTNTIVNRVATCTTDSCNKSKRRKDYLCLLCIAGRRTRSADKSGRPGSKPGAWHKAGLVNLKSESCCLMRLLERREVN